MWAYRARAHKPFLSFINRALAGHFSGAGSISGSHKKKDLSLRTSDQEEGLLVKLAYNIIKNLFI